MRPLRNDKDEGDPIVQKISGDSLTINGHTFTFDSVADVDSTQVWFLILLMMKLIQN
jgi:kinesin family protein 15